jgi:hypothetical protein
MFTKLQTIYPNSIITKQQPDDYFDHYHWFSNGNDEWIGIPKEDILENQLTLLRSLFDFNQPGNPMLHSSRSAQNWYSFLFKNGPKPNVNTESPYRLTYFQWASGNISYSDFEAAIQAFFDLPIIIIWENPYKGIILEQKSNYALTHSDFIAMNETLKTDFFIEPIFYIGKFRYLHDGFISQIQHERSLLEFALHTSKKEKVFHFESIAPRLIANQLPNSIFQIIQQNIYPVFKEDRELFLSIKTFLTNNLNSSHTAKELYIHRNTLQYRIDKFTEKTGIVLKDFSSAMVVYIACILFESEE